MGKKGLFVDRARWEKWPTDYVEPHFHFVFLSLALVYELVMELNILL